MKDSDRVGLVSKIFEEKRQYSKDLEIYAGNLTKYGESHILHVREAHFLQAFASTSGDLAMNDISDILRVTPGATSQLATKLEDKKYIIRYKHPEDKRVSMVKLLEKGKEFVEIHLAYDEVQYNDISENLFKNFSNEDLEKIYQYEKMMTEFVRYKNKLARLCKE